MGELELAPGETTKLVSQPGPDEAYNIQVRGSDIYLGHRKAAVKTEGDRVRAGDRIQVSNLRGKNLFAKNPSTSTQNATIEVSLDGFSINFFPRAVQASVQADADTAAAPRSDNFESFAANGLDVSTTADVVTFGPPDRADFVHVLADTDGSSVTCEVKYGTDGGPYIGPSFSGSGDGAVAQRVAVFNPECEITFSGSATSLDYRIYAR